MLKGAFPFNKWSERDTHRATSQDMNSERKLGKVCIHRRGTWKYS